jgi:hypothetical protein
MSAPRSPIADAIDRLVWSRMSSFWTKAYNQDDKEALNAVYEGCAQVLDAELVRLFEINQSKSLSELVPYTQRRWLRLDMNKYDQLEAFLRFLSAQASPTGTIGTGDMLSCETRIPNHSKHWHIGFPWTVPQGDTKTRTTLELLYPIDFPLVEIYRIAVDPTTGKRLGSRLRPGIDYLLSGTGAGLVVPAAVPGEVYEVNVAFNLNGAQFEGLVPVVTYTPGYLVRGNLVPTDTGLQIANLPVHAMVVKNAPESGSGGLLDTNTADYNSDWRFLPWTGGASGPRHAATPGAVALPTTQVVNSEDGVFVFGLVRGRWDLSHRHIVTTTVLNPGAMPFATSLYRNAGFTDKISFPELIDVGVFGSRGGLGHMLEVFVNGKLLPRSEYAFRGDGQLHLKTPIYWTEGQYVPVTIRATGEYRSLQSNIGDQHVHFECLLRTAEPPQFFETFDDGGDFDDEQGGVFDDVRTLNVVYLDDQSADLTTLEVFVDGRLLLRDTDYVAIYDETTKRIRISFTFGIRGLSIYAVYRRTSRTYVYGRFPALGMTKETLSGRLTDLKSIFTSFGQVYSNANAAELGSLVEAANVSSGGGNPLFTLFFDEREEYSNLPLDADWPALSSQDTRVIESQNLKLIGIPFLVDHVLHPTVRLEQGVDYDVTEGSILSSVDLAASRGPDDAQPGVWWCPVVLVDENYMARNFGLLVNDVRTDSAVSYRQALEANFGLRFTGPVMKNIEWSAAVMTGSPFFTQDSVVRSVREEIVGWSLTIAGDNIEQHVDLPAGIEIPTPGSPIVRSQSVAIPPLFNGKLAGLLSHTGPQIVVDMPFTKAQTGDVAFVETFNPDEPTIPVIFKSQIQVYQHDPDYLPPRTTIVFVNTPRWPITKDSTMRILRDGGPPYASIDGVVFTTSPKKVVVVETDHETYKLPAGTLTEYRVGDHVSRGQPLFKRNAKLYDHNTRPNWHWLYPEQVRQEWAFATSGLGMPVSLGVPDDRRNAVIDPPVSAGGYSQISLDPILPYVERGSKATFTDDESGQVTEFTVIGRHGVSVLVSPAVSDIRTGIVHITPRENLNTRPNEYFESASPQVGAAVEAPLAFPQPVRTRSLQLTNTSNFPDAGCCSIRLPNGGSVQIIYHRKSNGFLLDCEWPDVMPSLTGPSPGPGLPGPLDTQLPATAVVRLISAYERRRVNPSFVALANNRIVRDVRTQATFVDINEKNADVLYDLMKTSSAVLELSAVSRPAALRDMIEDVVPPTSTLVLLNRHRIIDTYAGGYNEV